MSEDVVIGEPMDLSAFDYVTRITVCGPNGVVVDREVTGRYVCIFCLACWDKPGEAEHHAACPANTRVN